MREVIGRDLWDFASSKHWLVITTNGFVKQNGDAAMGRGIAHEAAKRYPKLARSLGHRLLLDGNHVYPFPDYRLLTFPVKVHWRDMASLTLIRRSAEELREWMDYLDPTPTVYMVRPGCGNGRLHWAAVRPILKEILDYRVTIVEKGAL